MEITGMRTMKSVFVGLVSIALLAPAQGWAWGVTGHRTVAEIASSLIQPATKKRINTLLSGQSMISVATWADAIRTKPEWAETAWYHFEKIDDGKSYLENLKGLPHDQQDLGGVVMAILQAEKVFISPSVTDQEKANALKFIIHFVGDIHQPLHTGRPEDKGGNKIPRVWDGVNTNLHAIWDSLIIEKGHQDIFSIAPKANQEDIYGPYLTNKFKDTKLTVRQLTDVNVWVDECLQMRPDAYTYMDEDAAHYSERFIDTVDSRIYLAGVRLAAMLNQMVMQEQPPTARVQFVGAIEKVVGALSEIISFQPRPLEGGGEPGGSNGGGEGQQHP
jgi:hypothetical protein